MHFCRTSVRGLQVAPGTTEAARDLHPDLHQEASTHHQRTVERLPQDGPTDEICRG